MTSYNQGRIREAREVVRLRRAAEVGRMLLGELDRPIEDIRVEHYVDKPRRELQAELLALRSSFSEELRRFCQQNFTDASPADLAALYEGIKANNSYYRLPLRDFVECVGQPSPGVLRDAPAHSTIHISPWGLQAEFPEMFLARDLALSFNEALELDLEEKEVRQGRISWGKAKGDNFRKDFAAKRNRKKYSMRMCLISCFNLVEAYINGIAWEFVQNEDIESLPQRQQKLLSKGQASLLEKLVKIPVIVTGLESGPLSEDRDPLLTFRNLVKPFRDSTVHASPFSAPEQFGGYDKLARVYELEMDTVVDAVDLALKIIETIHEFLGRGEGLPAWMAGRDRSGRFIMEDT